MPDQMKAVRIHEYGGADVLRYEDAPVPPVGQDEIRIRSHTAAVNPADWKMRNGAFKGRAPLTFPFILGSDLSGTVDVVGPLVRRFRPGDPVFARVDNAYAEFVVAKSDVVAPAPKSISLAEAAGLPVAIGTAWSVLFDVAGLKAGQSVLIHAASGGVGSIAVQLAKIAGAKVYATTSSANVDLVKGLGADIVIDYREDWIPDFAGKLDVVIDTLGGDVQRQSFALLKKGGILSSIVAPPDEAVATAFGVRATFGRRESNGARLEEAARLVDAGLIRVLIEKSFPLSEVAAAQALSETGRARGKILLRIAL